MRVHASDVPSHSGSFARQRFSVSGTDTSVPVHYAWWKAMHTQARAIGSNDRPAGKGAPWQR